MNPSRSEKSSNRLRRRRTFLTSSLLLAIVATTSVAWSQQQQYKVDPAASQIRFALKGSPHSVEGTFHVTSGDFTLDPVTGVMTGVVSVDAASGESDEKSRDKKMAKDELKAQTFSTITFAPAKFSGAVKDSGDSTGQVDGSFTLIGQSHPITVPMAVHCEAGHFTATGSFQIPFVTWGMKDPSFMMFKVEKEVKIDLKLVGNVTK